MPVAVVIELAAAEQRSPDVPALVEACSRAGAETSCAIARVGERDPPAGGALAIVAWSSDHREARIAIALQRDARAEWYSRDLVFRAEDDERERWRSVGLVIATVVGVASGGGVHGELLPAGERPKGAPPTPAAPAPPTLPKSPSPKPGPPPVASSSSADASQRRVAIDLVALAGPALDDGTARFGGGLRGSGRFYGPLFASVDARFSARPRDARGVSTSWATAGAALGARATVAPWLDFEARAGLFGELLHASVDEPKAGGEDAGSRGAAAGDLALDAVVMPSPTLGAFVGLDAPWVPGTTAIEVGGVRVGTEPVVTVLVHAGVRVAF